MRDFLESVAQAGRELLGLSAGREPAGELIGLCRELLKLEGEAAAIALADSLLTRYAALDTQGQRRFFLALLEHLEPSAEAVLHAIAEYENAPGPLTLVRLSQAAESPRRELLRALNMAPGGTAALVRMRGDLLTLLAQEPRLEAVDSDFADAFRAWFNRGFLHLSKIDWETPAFILEKLIAYEAVHEIRGWDDLRRRLAHDRRCFAFFHPALPDEPLIFVQVALVKGLATNIEQVLASSPADAAAADTAIFYSISNCQRGLQGISFGNFLIKQVTDMLALELPSIRMYATLSPIPGFRRWLQAALMEAPDELPLEAGQRGLLTVLDQPDWTRDVALGKLIKPVLRKLCAHYLLKVKQGAEPRDAVARFHLRNGARLERINWLADQSSKGVQESATLMVNYVYDRKTVLRNHEALVNRGEIAASAAVRKLLA